MRTVLLFGAAVGLTAALYGALPKRKPQMGWNSWNCYHSSVTEQDLKDTADFFVASGLRTLGYSFVCTDDAWMGPRGADGVVTSDPTRFAGGIKNLTDYIHARGLRFGIYSAASSVVCSGRAGSLYNEHVDAQTYADWGVDYVKYDNCGQYGLGNARFVNFADAVNATGRDMFISTEPFLLVPNTMHATFSHSWRTTNDISANWATILDRADRNDKWADISAHGINDPDMVRVRCCRLASCLPVTRTVALRCPLVFHSDTGTFCLHCYAMPCRICICRSPRYCSWK